MPSLDLKTGLERTGDPTGGIVRTQTKDALLSEQLERTYVEMQSTWADTFQKYNNFFHNAQFTTEQVNELKRRAQAATPINVIYPATEQAVAMLTTNKPRFQATAREDSDRKTARLYADLMSWIWEQSDGNSRLKTACYDYYVGGRGALMAYVDPNKDYGRGEICIIDVDPLDVYPDPNSKDRLWRDAAHILISRVFTREQIQAMWPDAEDRGLLARAASTSPNTQFRTTEQLSANQFVGKLQETDSYHEQFKVIERYSRVKQQIIHIHDTTTDEEKALTKDEYRDYLGQPALYASDGKQEFYFTEGDGLQEWLAIYAQAAPVAGSDNTRVYTPPPQQDPATGRETQGPDVAITLLTIADLVDDGLIDTREVLVDRIKLVITIGGEEYYNVTLPVSQYPIVPLNNRHSRNPYPMSDIAFVQPIQEAINDLHRKIVANLASTTGQKLIVPRGSIDRKVVERDIAKAGTTVIEVDYELGDPKVFGAGAMPGGLFQHFDMLVEMVQRELGVFHLQSGDPNAAPETYRGTLIMDDFGQRRIKSKLDDIEGAITQLGRVVCEMIPYVYREEKVIRLVQPNHTVEESVANQLVYNDYGEVIEKLNDLSQATVDLIVVSGSTLPSNRWALDGYMQRLYELGVVDQVEVLKKSELVDVEGVLARTSMIQQLQAQIEELENRNKDLEGQVKSAVTNELTAKKQAIVANMKAEEGRSVDELKKGTQLFNARLGDQLAMQRERAKMEQSRPNTNA